MKHALDFVRQLLEDEALGDRIVAAPALHAPAFPPFGFRDIEAMCRFALPKQRVSIRLSFFGRNLTRAAYLDRDGFYDFEQIDRLHRGGATVIANQVHNFSGSVHRLKLRLEHALHCYVGVNCYATPGKAQGLGRHVDSHDVIVIQLHGRKQWQLFERAPRADGDYTMDGFIQDEPTEERILSPGDMLYMPAGFVHAARSVDGATSIHLTVGFSQATWKTFLGAWVNAAAQTDDTLNGDVPAALLRRGAPSEAIERRARTALNRVAATPVASAHRHFVSYASATSVGEAETSGADVPVDMIAADTVLSKVPGVFAEVFAGALRIRTANGRLVDLRRECGDAWTEIERRPTFRPSDLGGRIPGGKEALFCYYLLNNGLLTRP